MKNLTNKINLAKAVKVSKLISYNFLSTLITESSLTKMGDFYPNVESRKLAREWFAMQFFVMVWSISSFYKDNPIGIEISKGFRLYTVEGLSEAGVFDSEDEAEVFIKSRSESYNEVTSSKKDNPLLKLSLKFLEFIDQKDPLLIINSGEQIATFLKVNINLIKEADNLANLPEKND